MTQLNDLQTTALRDQGFSGALPEMMIDWAQANGATSAQLNIAVMEALKNNGATSTTYPELWQDILDKFGYDTVREFWENGGYPYFPGATFDGTNDYLSHTSSFTGDVDGTHLTIAARFRSGVDGVERYIFDSQDSRVGIILNSSNELVVATKNSAGGNLNILIATAPILVADGYINILACIDTSVALALDSYLYISDTDVTNRIVATSGTVDFTDPSYFAGCKADTTQKLNGDINFLYVNQGEYFDFSVEANRRKFFDASGDLVDLGTDGSAPTGSPPSLYLSGRYTTWHNNLSGNGGMTVTGALSEPAL